MFIDTPRSSLDVILCIEILDLLFLTSDDKLFVETLRDIIRYITYNNIMFSIFNVW